MSEPDEAQGLSDIRAALQAHGGGARSPLFRWMYRHHDELVGMFAEARPGWRHVTAELAGRGFTAPDGGELRPETVRKLWLRVRRRHETARVAVADRQAVPHSGAAGPQPADGADVLARFRAKIDERSGRKP